MKCLRCTAENQDVRKFCLSCGAPLGRHCDRCGTVNGHDDKYCGVCGFALIASLKKDMSQAAEPRGPRQYTEAEIEELLSLRSKLQPGQKNSSMLTQQDIDQLFT